MTGVWGHPGSGRPGAAPITLDEFRPEWTIVGGDTDVPRPRFPVVDVHNHLGGTFGGGWDGRGASALLDVLDEAGVELLVDLDGGFGEHLLDLHLRVFKEAAPERFILFGGVDWDRWVDEGDRFPDAAASRLRAQAARGAEGLKIWKHLGLHVRDHRGRLVTVDDPRLDVVWATAGALRLPVLIHVADPPAFFQPVDGRNEMFGILQRVPEWSFHDPDLPDHATLIDALCRVVERHPATTFIGAHVAGLSHDLDDLAARLRRLPNLYVDTGARLFDLGRQPRRARRLITEHPDRVLFGLDEAPDVAAYRRAWRFYESDDECFRTSPQPFSGSWPISALDLDTDSLRRLYRDNALAVLGRSPTV